MSKIIIFEGPDGSGKSTLAAKAVRQLNARYVHFGPHTSVKKTVARMYVEAALPALLGYQDVVFDRSWLSEVPYGVAFRQGADRLGPESRRMLERIFMRCETTVVRCDPGWDELERNFLRDQAAEMLDSITQLSVVYAQYEKQHTALPHLVWDYTRHEEPDWDCLPATPAHSLDTETAGNLEARILVVGESYAELTDADSFYQKPFCAFSGAGCSRWLTRELELVGIGEERLLWCNADQLTRLGDVYQGDLVFNKILALGVAATSASREYAERFGRASHEVHELEHPQSHKRFKFNQPYPLSEALL